MDAVYYVIAILGCGDGSVQCAPVATVPTQYSSEAACALATQDALIENSDLDFPMLVARCRPEHSRPASSPATIEGAKSVVIALKS